MYSRIAVPNWPTNGEGSYSVHVDESTIPEGCQWVFFSGAPDDDQVNQGECFNFYRRVPSEGKCTSLSLAPRFGYAMCCGDACTVEAGDFPTKPSKRSLPISKSSAVRPRDVTQIKRSPPFSRPFKRDDCAFKPSNGETNAVITYGQQVRVTSLLDCQSTTECTDGVSFSYSQSTTNTFGVSTELGGSLFEILSASISFSYEHSETEEKSYETTYSGTRPAGSKGYITFTPKMECSPKGTFTGDCNDWKTDVEGNACFPVFISGAPDGIFTFVQTN
ncbi:hypothetical protein GQ43DRAFT_17407 [Delitschia confertaspora ATCC 74209]|uniref:Uncharacterized protein n=1 Tax=Delitschia confertaspora ATCC 74209 TaxID=1513339 RepID=A0A9P4JPB0_9PLEO|nr:hypothetical protein GQ43DRAFT_17407 [Delitschia confertaspora ATCC 74209]